MRPGTARRVLLGATATVFALAAVVPAAFAQGVELTPTELVLGSLVGDGAGPPVLEFDESVGPWLNAVDPVGDNNFFSTGETTGLGTPPPETDITRVVGASWVPIPGFYNSGPDGPQCDQLGSPRSPDFFSACGSGGVDEAAFAAGATVFNFTLGGPPGGLRPAGQVCEWVVWLNRPGAGETWVNRTQFPLDPANGTNRAIGVRRSDDGLVPFSLDLIESFFTPVLTHSIAILAGNQLELHVPNDEIEGATQVNPYAFCTGGTFSAADSTGDQTGLINLDPDAMNFFSVAPASPPAPLGFQKQFTDDPTTPGDTVTLEFTIENLSDSPEATDITFTDELDFGSDTLTAVNLPLTNPCGEGSTFDGTTSLQLTGGSLLPGETCSFFATLEVPATADEGSFTNTTSPLEATVGNAVVTSEPASDALTVESDEIIVSEVADDTSGGSSPPADETGGGYSWALALLAGVLIALIVAAVAKKRQADGAKMLGLAIGTDIPEIRDAEESGIDTYADGTVMEWYMRTSEGTASTAESEGSVGNNFASRTYTYLDGTIRVETTGGTHRHIEITHPDRSKEVYDAKESWQRAPEGGDIHVFENSHHIYDAEGNIVSGGDWDLVPPPHPWGDDPPAHVTVINESSPATGGKDDSAPISNEGTVPIEFGAIPDVGESGSSLLDDGTVHEWYRLIPDVNADGNQGLPTAEVRRNTYTYPDKTVRAEIRTESYERVAITHPDGSQDVFEIGRKWENTPEGYREVSYDNHTQLDASDNVVERAEYGDGPPPFPWDLPRGDGYDGIMR